MQLLLDTEPTIDINRNMSNVSEESLIEKIDNVIQDLKNGICNGNKENIQGNDNMISIDNNTNSEDDKVGEIIAPKSTSIDNNTNSEDDKVEEIIAPKSPSIDGKPNPEDDKVEEIITPKSPSIGGKPNSEDDKVEEIIAPKSPSISGKPNSEDDKVEEIIAPRSPSISGKPISEDDKADDIISIEPETTDDKKSEVDKIVPNSPVPHENEEKVDTVVLNHKDNACDVAIKEATEEEINLVNPNSDAENISSKDSHKIHEDDPSIVERTEEADKSDSIEIINGIESSPNKIEEPDKSDNREDLVKQIPDKTSCYIESDITATAPEVIEMVELDEKSKIDKVDEKMEVNESIENNENVAKVVENIDQPAIVKVDKQSEDVVSEKTKNVIEVDKAEVLEDEVVEKNAQTTKDDSSKSEENDELQQLNDVNKEITKKESNTSSQHEVMVASPNPETQNTTPDPQMPNELKVSEQLNIENIENNVDTSNEEIETVDLDEEEKVSEVSDQCLGIVNIDNESNIQKATNNGSVTDEKEDSVVVMETVDLDDEKDVSESEPMDIDKTEEIVVKEVPMSISTEESVITLNCESAKESLSKKSSHVVELDNKELPMDEDVHPVDNSSNKSEKTSSDTINIPDDGVKEQDKISEPGIEDTQTCTQKPKVTEELKNVPSILKLSNTLDILSDDEDEVVGPPITPPQPQNKEVENAIEKQCINIDDDDDIMLIDEEDISSKKSINEPVKPEVQSTEAEPKTDNELNEKKEEVKSSEQISEEVEKVTEPEKPKQENVTQPEEEKDEKISEAKPELTKPLLPNNFLKTCKKNMAEMTRDDLEEFCILKIVESVVDRSSLSEIKTKLKSMAQSIEEYKKKAMMLTKQNRDLQVVLKTIQEEQKNSKTVTPLKITRSVGMQVLMTERSSVRRKPPGAIVNISNNSTPTKSPRPTNQRPVKVTAAPSPQQIPVPRLIPASNSPAAKNIPQIHANNAGKTASPVNGVRNTPQKAEKRGFNRNSAVTVDLTEDEPPNKMMNRNSTPTPVRVVPPHMVPQNLLASTPRHPIGPNNNPRKVYIPISGPQNSNPRPGQAIMLKPVTSPTQNLGLNRPRGPQPHLSRLPQNQIRMSRVQNRHPAPLPESTKQYPGTYLKALPPAPDLKLSKVENGIVISWKIEGYQEDSYEEIASYQLYAYQETSSPPSTALWKKIGDVKALPLPMACTLTQFMAGFKYYFAVRAVDIRSRIGPFSLPGSILLLNKL